MNDMPVAYKRRLSNPKETLVWGHDFALRLKAGDIIILSGGLGAGKTLLTRGLAQGLGISDPISSPTFTSARIYSPGSSGIGLVHMDLYRIIDNFDSVNSQAIRDVLADQIASLDIDDYRSDSVIVIEWGKDAADFFADTWYEIVLSVIDENTRELQFNTRSYEDIQSAIV